MGLIDDFGDELKIIKEQHSDMRKGLEKIVKRHDFDIKPTNRFSRCIACGLQWPCPTYVIAKDALPYRIM